MSVCLSVCMYVCMYLYTCVYIYICTYAYVYMHICTYAYICIYICLYAHMHIYTYMHICTYAYIYVYIYTCIYVHMHTFIYIYIYTYIYISIHDFYALEYPECMAKFTGSRGALTKLRLASCIGCFAKACRSWSLVRSGASPEMACRWHRVPPLGTWKNQLVGGGNGWKYGEKNMKNALKTEIHNTSWYNDQMRRLVATASLRITRPKKRQVSFPAQFLQKSAIFDRAS